MPTSGSHGFLLVGLRIGIVGPPTASSLRNFVIRADLMTHGSSHPTPSAACTFGEKTGRKALVASRAQEEKPRFTGVWEADDGTRTHDLLHGKRGVGGLEKRWKRQCRAESGAVLPQSGVTRLRPIRFDWPQFGHETPPCAHSDAGAAPSRPNATGEAAVGRRINAISAGLKPPPVTPPGRVVSRVC
jgi:hypothetical protein